MAEEGDERVSGRCDEAALSTSQRCGVANSQSCIRTRHGSRCRQWQWARTSVPCIHAEVERHSLGMRQIGVE